MLDILRVHAFFRAHWKISPIVLSVAASFVAVPSSAPGEIYKYKDDDGRWQYTDRPPAHVREAEVVGDVDGPPAKIQDLDTYLNDKISPETPVQQAALAVIAIKTESGVGAGFFVTADGYILTNKHVVRPSESTAWKAQQEKISEAKSTLSTMELNLRDRKNQMERTATDMTRLNDIVASNMGSIKIRAQHDYDQLKEYYRLQKREYHKLKSVFQQNESDFRKHEHDFRRKSASGSTQSDFRIFLHDGTQKTARLVSISRERDLALLKLDGHRTPSLRSSGSGGGLGTPVYAIGTPLGLSVAMTSGVITGRKGDFIITDAEILPGNSGGPLITNDGSVIGVNRARLVAKGQSAYTEGFGMAIPIGIAIQEFPKIQ